jgi:SM-20-related protein
LDDEVKMSETSEVQNVEVQVTLTGGLRYSSVLPSTSPILRDLYLALGSRDAPESRDAAFLVQLPIDGGTSACSFMSSSLVALQTRPPVLIQTPVAETVAPTSDALLYHVVIEDFLTPGENESLLRYALDKEASFEGSGVFDGPERHRKSKVLYAIKHSKWQDVFRTRLKLHLPYILLGLGVPHFRLGDFEIQLTASNDGDYFKAHADHSPEQAGAASRQITFVYYLHREPRPFAGGGLLLYGGRPDPFIYASARSVTTIEPRNNSLVAFGSQRWHELDMVRCPSGMFADSRFTVNGWLHPAAAAS